MSNDVVNWVQVVFPKYRNEMKGQPWGFLYNEYKDKKFDTVKLEEEISELMLDDEVTSKKGIYLYVLNRKEKHLNLRAFTPKQKREAYEKQVGKCAKCGNPFDINEMEADHIKPWSKGGKTEPANCQMLCQTDNREKSGK